MGECGRGPDGFLDAGGGFGGWLHVKHPWWLALMLFSAVVFADLFLRLWVKSRHARQQIA